MDIRERIIKQLASLNVMENLDEYLRKNDDLTELEIDSLSFIKFVVALEDEFNIEFDDDALDYNKFITLSSLCAYISYLLKSEERCEEDYRMENEKTEQIKDVLFQMIYRYYNKQENGSLNGTSQLTQLGLTMEQNQNIFLDIKLKYGIIIDEQIIVKYALFTINELCYYISSQL